MSARASANDEESADADRLTKSPRRDLLSFQTISTWPVMCLWVGIGNLKLAERSKLFAGKEEEGD